MKSMGEMLKDYAFQMRDSMQLGADIKLERGINRIVVAGLGGSGWPGDILKSILCEEKTAVSVEVVRDYSLPAYVNDKTLVFAVSYSGNTEETILMYSDALKKNAQVVVVASGGKLRWLITEADKPVHLIRIPSGYQPRLATCFILMAMLNVLRGALPKSLFENIDRTIQALNKPESFSKSGEGIAAKLYGKVPVIYASNRFFPVAYAWKIAFNETSKAHAFCNSFPELNHNEMSGFLKLNSNYHVIIIRDEKEHPQIKKRIELTKNLIREHNVDVTELAVKGDSFLTKILTAVYLGMHTAHHLALKNEVDPLSVNMQEKFKENLQ